MIIITATKVLEYRTDNILFNKIVIMGLGYIGLPTAAIFASLGKKVLGVDINPEVVNTINQGQIHITEPGLAELINTVVTQGYLAATLKPEPADAYLIAVPTPCDEHKNPDLSYIQAAIKAIAPVLKKGNLIILESTSPVGTTEKICHWLAEQRNDLIFPHQNPQDPDIYVAHCPERVLPGHVLNELIKNNRIIGGMSQRCTLMAKKLYQIFIHSECFETDARTAEMVKLTENSFRDVNIAFANELSMICDKLQIDVWELIRLANNHPRVNILNPGPGVGGHCIAVDPWFIIASAPKQSRLIQTAREINDIKPYYVIEKILKYCQNKSKMKITCLGLAFKADTEDLRESPAMHIIKNLLAYPHLELNIVEPYIDMLPTQLVQHEQIKLISVEQASQNNGLLVSLVKHQAFIEAQVLLIKNKEKILDFVNLFPKKINIETTHHDIEHQPT